MSDRVNLQIYFDGLINLSGMWNVEIIEMNNPLDKRTKLIRAITPITLYFEDIYAYT